MSFGRFTHMFRCRTISMVLALLISACASLQPSPPQRQDESLGQRSEAESKAQDVVIFALGLMETGYRFGGKNPDAGLDCSGMVSYVFEHATGLRLVGSAAEMARKGKQVAKRALKPGDLVFFNTLNRSHSHVGIYLGDERFIHAPSSAGKVRVDSLISGWYASRFEEGRRYVD